ncbi:hypothetical protein RclHR1_05220013 [Rhizophagus clarus]|uniref:DUF7905 domain-containing protein n=1 Tax=Rhizophagus clarus TaxID=94130 RepID=A0A2Z6RLF3_9GLOM|nr:hypothetical protein RclHR1_05220013 [Rhizophagus clarus]GES79142.1 hypothetical protein GLOIN_2v1601756 [Rhizophagus clarus]
MSDNGEISYNIITFWVFSEDDIRAIEEECRELEDAHGVKIEYVRDKKLFDIKGTDYEELDRTRDRLFEVLKTKSDKQSYGVPRYKKRELKFKESAPGLPPPLEEPIPLMLEKEEEKIPEGSVGLFSFDRRIKIPDDLESIFGQNQRIPFIQTDYWKDICKSCNVDGEIIYDERRIEFTKGKKENVEKAKRKLNQLERNFLRKKFDPKRVQLVHYSNVHTNFKIIFCPPDNHPYFKDAKMSYFDDVCILAYHINPEPNSKNLDNNERMALDRRMKGYNLTKMSDALKKGLEYVRIHQGEIRLFGSLGKVMFTKVEEVKGRYWNFMDLEDVISRYNIKTRFDEDVSHDNITYRRFDSYFSPDKKKDYTEYYEIKADARNSPNDVFTEVYMRVNRSSASLMRVGSKWESLVNIDWTMLNMKSDIAINLATRRIFRHDVEPFVSFKKRLSINPEFASTIAYENVDKRIKSKKGALYDTYVRYLEVKSIDFKQVTTKKVNENFTCQLTRVERLKIDERPPNKGLGESSGDTRDVFYTIEVLDDRHNKAFEQNISLESGDVARWTVDDIIGEGPNYNTLCDFVRSLLSAIS